MEVARKPWQVRQTTLEIDLGLLKQNYKILSQRSPLSEFLVLLKSDAYGHSFGEVSRCLEKLGPKERLHGYGVANVEEGIELRRVGIQRPIYIMSGIQDYDGDLHRCVETCDLVPVISSLRVLKQVAKVTKNSHSVRPIHLKFNTGMNRLGIDREEISSCLSILHANPQILVQGMMSHLAMAEKPQNPLTLGQVKDFREIIQWLKKEGISPKYQHLCNSAGLAHQVFPEGNLQRVGLHIYGVGDPELNPIAKWTAQLYQIRDLKKNEKVGYGAHFKAKKKMRMAILGVGYGDGYRRNFSNKAEVLVRGRRCPVIGAVSMDLTAIDITHVPQVNCDDRAVLLGRDGKEEISADELAKHAGSISWEILTGISLRVPRVFK